MLNSRGFYLMMMVIGTILPWYFFAGFMAENGMAFGTFMSAMNANSVVNGAVSDLLVSTAVFWVWSYGDAQRMHVANWWLVIPATLAVGLSLALPLYLWLRAGSTDAKGLVSPHSGAT